MTQLTQQTQSDTKYLRGNTKTLRSRKWSLTLNNYTEQELDTLTQHAVSKCSKYIIGKEVGENNGTPHLQIYFEYKNPRSQKSMKSLNNRAHLEVVKGTAEQNRAYCSKEGNVHATNMIKADERTIEERLIDAEYKNVIWRDWQQNAINVLNEPVDKRIIYWFWESTGNVGKSYLCKYISIKYGAIICTGKTNDIFNQVLTWRNNNPEELQCPPCIIDVPRSEFCHINYAALEQLKNGFMYSGKYEGGKVHCLSPHIVVFANYPPNTQEMSKDRWAIFNLNEDDEEEGLNSIP